MNKTVMFLQADMHRAINSGQNSMIVHVADLKELIGEVMRAEARDTLERTGQVLGFINSKQLTAMASGGALYCTIRRKKDPRGEYTQPVYRDVIQKDPLPELEE